VRKRIVSVRYASALLNVAKEEGVMEELSEELGVLKKIIIETPGLKRFLESPHITQADKTALIQKALSPILSRLTINFVLLLVRKYRLRFLPEIIEEYHRLVDEEKSIQRTDVITVQPLNDDLIEKLRNTMERIMKKTVKFCFYVDPGILGGVIVKTPTLIIDGSIRKRLMDLRYALMTTRV